MALVVRDEEIGEEEIQDQTNNYICADVLELIQCRLPVRDLHRCKSISNDWRRMISNIFACRVPPRTVSGLYVPTALLQPSYKKRNWDDPISGMAYRGRTQFINSFFSKLSERHYVTDCVSLANRRRIILKKDLPPDLVTKNADMEPQEIEEEEKEFVGMSYLDILPFSPRGKDFIDCCNGLLLFFSAPTRQYYVCNPATKQLASIPPLQYSGDRNAALAYNPLISPHFKIVHFHLESSHEPQWLDLFDSSAGEWFQLTVQIEAPGDKGQFRFSNRPVYLDGVLFMLSWYRKIYCFDLHSSSTEVTIYAIDPPDFEPEETFWALPRGCLGISTGTLCYTYRCMQGVHFWILDNPKCKTGYRWILKYNVNILGILIRQMRDISERPYNYFWMQPCAVDPNSDVIFLADVYVISRYNFKTDMLEILYESGPSTMLLGRFSHAFPYSRSLEAFV